MQGSINIYYSSTNQKLVFSWELVTIVCPWAHHKNPFNQFWTAERTIIEKTPSYIHRYQEIRVWQSWRRWAVMVAVSCTIQFHAVGPSISLISSALSLTLHPSEITFSLNSRYYFSLFYLLSISMYCIDVCMLCNSLLFRVLVITWDLVVLWKSCIRYVLICGIQGEI